MDYILCNHDAFGGLTACSTLEDHPLDTSDHLLVSCSMALLILLKKCFHESTKPPWLKTSTERGNHIYCTLWETNDIVQPLLNRDYSSVEELNSDMLSVAEAVKNAASKHIPSLKRKSTDHNKVYDWIFSHLCWKNRCAFWKWKAASRPQCGQLYGERRKCERGIQHHLNRESAHLKRQRLQQRDKMFNLNWFRSGVHTKACVW